MHDKPLLIVLLRSVAVKFPSLKRGEGRFSELLARLSTGKSPFFSPLSKGEKMNADDTDAF
jgi:hypothetical protein